MLFFIDLPSVMIWVISYFEAYLLSSITISKLLLFLIKTLSLKKIRNADFLGKVEDTIQGKPKTKKITSMYVHLTFAMLT